MAVVLSSSTTTFASTLEELFKVSYTIQDTFASKKSCLPQWTESLCKFSTDYEQRISEYQAAFEAFQQSHSLRYVTSIFGEDEIRDGFFRSTKVFEHKPQLKSNRVWGGKSTDLVGPVVYLSDGRGLAIGEIYTSAKLLTKQFGLGDVNCEVLPAKFLSAFYAVNAASFAANSPDQKDCLDNCKALNDYISETSTGFVAPNPMGFDINGLLNQFLGNSQLGNTVQGFINKPEVKDIFDAVSKGDVSKVGDKFGKAFQNGPGATLSNEFGGEINKIFNSMKDINVSDSAPELAQNLGNKIQQPDIAQAIGGIADKLQNLDIMSLMTSLMNPASTIPAEQQC